LTAIFRQLTNLFDFLYFVSRILLLELQYCRVDTNNTDRQKQKVKDRENSEQKKNKKNSTILFDRKNFLSAKTVKYRSDS